jgi:hypothetical protein
MSLRQHSEIGLWQYEGAQYCLAGCAVIWYATRVILANLFGEVK